MTPEIVFALVVSAVGGAIIFHLFYLRPHWRETKRERLEAKPFPPEWESILQSHVPLYSRLPKPMRKRLRGHIQVFIDEKNFEGCGGLEITDTIRVCIAAQACILILNRNADYYPKLNSILVYPHAYFVKKNVSELIPVFEEKESRLGESWNFGTVVLAWDHVDKGTRDVQRGENLVLHEFAHQLDQEDGIADGTPFLRRRSSYVTWSRVLSAEYRQLQQNVDLGRRSVLDEYGAIDPAEFFAVATEAFFEKPNKLKKQYPELYRELMEFYQMDPSCWV